ncbi:hypothetical protein LCGC14_1137360 [marine sediment metagenome]|uniref:Uncharacterized protein n=1 Tax=marine sediment metagenome TaxID=412755 RepID=A0A0F9PHH9_9ZZZZ
MRGLRFFGYKNRAIRMITRYKLRKKASSPISRVLSWTVIHLGPASPQASSNLPESSAGHAIGLLFGLAPGGVYLRRELLPATRCALTAPFHPYRSSRTCHEHLGGLLSVALSVGSRRPGVTWHLALRSPDFPPPNITGGDCLASSAETILLHQPPCKEKHLTRYSAVFEFQSTLVQFVFAHPGQLGSNSCSFLKRQLRHQKIQQPVYVKRTRH